MKAATVAAVLASGLLACVFAPPGTRVELSREPVTLSPVAQVFSPDQPLPADRESVGVCVFPAHGYSVTGRWTLLTPDGLEAQLLARAELVGGKVVRFAAPSSTGSSLCVRPRRGGPLEAAVRRVSLVASTPIVAQRIVWESTPR